MTLDPWKDFLSKYFQAIQRFQKQMFGFGSPLPIGFLRIIMGGSAFVIIYLRIGQIDQFYTENGLLPSAVLESVFWHHQGISLLREIADVDTIRYMFYFFALGAIFMMIGLFSRVSTLIATLGIISINARNPLINGASMGFLRIIMIYLTFAENGAAFSLDRLIEKKLGINKLVTEYQNIPIWPKYLIAYQLALTYGTSVLHKLLDIRWRDGTAFQYYVFSSESRSRFPIPSFLINTPLSILATYSGIAIEIFIFTSIFRPSLRKWSLPLGILFHLSICYFLDVKLLSLLIISSYVVFLSDKQILTLTKRPLAWVPTLKLESILKK